MGYWDLTYNFVLDLKVFGLQPKSNPPVWVFSKDMQLQISGDSIIRLKETDSKYAVNGDCYSTYDYRGRNCLHFSPFFMTPIHKLTK